ncbi:MAG TPA: GNAT family N-acetyltransferase [Thermoanaerobaculia bacterium]
MIRALGDEDIDAYIALRQRALREHPLAFSSSADTDFVSTPDSLRPQLARAPDWMIFGAFESDTFAGAVGIYRGRHAKTAHRMQLWGMYVAPEHRGRGLGAQLLDAAIAHARARGDVAWIDLGVTTAAGAARRLYERAGFITWGTQHDVLRCEGHVADEHHMALRIR